MICAKIVGIIQKKNEIKGGLKMKEDVVEKEKTVNNQTNEFEEVDITYQEQQF